MEDDVTRLEPRVARIAGEVVQINSRLAGVEVDLRDLRKSMDQKLHQLHGGMSRLDAKLDARFEKLDVRFEKQDERFERQEARLEAAVEKLDIRSERQEERCERQDAKLEAAVDRVFTKIDRVDAKFEGRLEALSTRRFTLWVTLISAAATVAAAVLAVLFSAAHGH